MYTLNIITPYASTWTESYTTRRALRKATRALWKNLNFGEVLNTYAPDGRLIMSRTR